MTSNSDYLSLLVNNLKKRRQLNSHRSMNIDVKKAMNDEIKINEGDTDQIDYNKIMKIYQQEIKGTSLEKQQQTMAFSPNRMKDLYHKNNFKVEVPQLFQTDEGQGRDKHKDPHQQEKKNGSLQPEKQLLTAPKPTVFSVVPEKQELISPSKNHNNIGEFTSIEEAEEVRIRLLQRESKQLADKINQLIQESKKHQDLVQRFNFSRNTQTSSVQNSSSECSNSLLQSNLLGSDLFTSKHSATEYNSNNNNNNTTYQNNNTNINLSQIYSNRTSFPSKLQTDYSFQTSPKLNKIHLTTINSPSGGQYPVFASPQCDRNNGSSQKKSRKTLDETLQNYPSNHSKFAHVQSVDRSSPGSAYKKWISQNEENITVSNSRTQLERKPNIYQRSQKFIENQKIKLEELQKSLSDSYKPRITFQAAVHNAKTLQELSSPISQQKLKKAKALQEEGEKQKGVEVTFKPKLNQDYNQKQFVQSQIGLDKSFQDYVEEIQQKELLKKEYKDYLEMKRRIIEENECIHTPLINNSSVASLLQEKIGPTTVPQNQSSKFQTFQSFEVSKVDRQNFEVVEAVIQNQKSNTNLRDNINNNPINLFESKGYKQIHAHKSSQFLSDRIQQKSQNFEDNNKENYPSNEVSVKNPRPSSKKGFHSNTQMVSPRQPNQVRTKLNFA